MAWRAYLLPIETVAGGPGLTVERPKYLGPPAKGEPRGLIDAGALGVCIVSKDMSDEAHAALIANADVLAAPRNLLDTVANNTQRNAIRNRIEAFGIPAHWIEGPRTEGSEQLPGTTFLAILRGLACLMLLSRELRRRGDGRFLPNGVTMASTLGSLTAPQRDRIGDACLRLGWVPEVHGSPGVPDWASVGVTGEMTVRAFLRAVATRHARDIAIRGLLLPA